MPRVIVLAACLIAGLLSSLAAQTKPSGSQRTAPQPPAAARVTVTTVGPEEIPADRYPSSITISGDSSKIHYLSGRNTGPVTDGGNEDSGQPSIVDGKVTRSLVVRNQFGGAISPDGAHVAIIKRASGGVVVELDGKAGPTFLNITDGVPLFSLDSKRLAYGVVLKEGCATYIVDNKPSECFSRVGSPLFSPDGTRFAFVGNRSGRAILVTDGVPGREYAGVTTPVFSNDGRAQAYWTRQPDGWYLVTNIREDGPYDEAKGPNPTFSPEGKLAYVGVREGKTQLVVDAEPVAEAEDGFSSLVFSSTGKLAIFGMDVSSANLLIDGRRIASYGAAVGGIAFSSDGSHLAYGIQRDGQSYMVVDGIEHGAWQNIDTPPVFSPNGKHAAWVGTNEGKSRIVVDGVEAGPTFLGILRGARIIFTSENQLHLLVVLSETRSPSSNASLARVGRLEVAVNP